MGHDVPLPGGRLEQAVLVALWELRRATVREVHARVGAAAGLAYTTTAKVLDRLTAKGLVARERRGRTFLYRPKLKREVVERANAREGVARILGPDPGPAIAALVDAVAAIDRHLLDDLERAIEKRRRSRHGS